MPSLDILTLRHEPIQAIFISTSSSAIPRRKSPRTARQRASIYSREVRVMVDPRRPRDQRAVDLALGHLYKSTINNQPQITTRPTLDPRLKNRLVNRPSYSPGSALNPVCIPDDAPPSSAQDIIVIPDDEQLKPDPGTLPDVLHYHHSSLGLQNASAISYSPSTSSQQSHLFSTPNPYSTFQTSPSSASSSTVAGPSVLQGSSRNVTIGIWIASTCKQCNQTGHTAADHCEHCDAIGHVASEHCQVCDAVYCNANIHCNVCEKIDHTSKDHCELCREFGHAEDDHCVKCEFLKEESPVDSKPPTLEGPEEEVQHVEAISDPQFGWGDYSRSFSHFEGLQDGYQDAYRDDLVEEAYANTDIRQETQNLASESDIPINVPSADDDSKIVPGSSLDGRNRQRDAHANMSHIPKGCSIRQDTQRVSASADDNALVDSSSTAARRDRQCNPSPDHKVHVKAEMTIVKQEAEGSSVAYALKSEDVSEETKTQTVHASSPDVHRARSPIMTMSQIREEPVPAHMAKYWIPSIDGRRKPQISSQVIGNKRPKKPKPSELLTEKRQKTDVKLSKLCLTPATTPGKTIEKLEEGVWLDSELHIQWKDLCYMVLFEAPDHSTNLKQLHNLVTNWLSNAFQTHMTIHKRADVHYLETVMRASPGIKHHQRSPPSENPNSIEFSIRKDAIAEVEATVKAFRIKLATFKYQMCMLKYRSAGEKPRPRISFEKLIGMALHEAEPKLLCSKQLKNWIKANIPGYSCKGWMQGMLNELEASSFFIHQTSEKGRQQWTFREGCDVFFEKRD